jgi:hypothetical protein
MSDFQTADINELLNGDTSTGEKRDFNAVLASYDRELMGFKPRRVKPVWPAPIRKRICIK